MWLNSYFLQEQTYVQRICVGSRILPKSLQNSVKTKHYWVLNDF